MYHTLPAGKRIRYHCYLTANSLSLSDLILQVVSAPCSELSGKDFTTSTLPSPLTSTPLYRQHTRRDGLFARMASFHNAATA